MCTVSGCHLLTVVVSSAVGLSEYLLELYQKEFEHGFCESSYVFSVFEYELVYQLILFLFFGIELVRLILSLLDCKSFYCARQLYVLPMLNYL